MNIEQLTKDWEQHLIRYNVKPIIEDKAKFYRLRIQYKDDIATITEADSITIEKSTGNFLLSTINTTKYSLLFVAFYQQMIESKVG